MTNRIAQIPEPPEHLPPAAADEWRRVAPELASRGPIHEADASLLAAYCAAFSDWRKAREEVDRVGPVVKSPSGYAQVSPYLSIANAAEKRMHALLKSLRLTPATRPHQFTAWPATRLAALCGTRQPAEVIDADDEDFDD